MERKSILAGLVLGALLAGCGTSPEDPPRFRVKNESSDKASIQIKTSGGSTLNINGVDPGVTTAYQATAEGRIEVTGTVQKDTTKAMGSFDAVNDRTYTIRVLATTPTTLAIASP